MRNGRTWVIGLALAFVGGVALAAGPGGVTDYWTSLWQERLRAREASASGVQTEFTEVIVKNPAGKQVAGMLSDPAGNGIILVTEPTGATPRAAMGVTPAGAGRVMVWSSAGVLAYGMDGDQGIGAFGADVAENFPATSDLPEGTVLVIDPERKGFLTASTAAYDRRVAGVVAGTTKHRPAMTLNSGLTTDRKVPVTLTGTAYCLATSVNGAIKAGDLLTTSAVPGHAMKVTDYEAARGAILGKALEDLKGDKGHVLMLASLQ